MAQTFRQRIAQAEAMARADMLRFQPEVSSEVFLLRSIRLNIVIVIASLMTLLVLKVPVNYQVFTLVSKHNVFFRSRNRDQY